MATLVLTAAGSILGPVGGAVGALIGQSIDQRLLKPKGREGPRLQDLRVQTSSYGSPIPKLFGTMRVAGTVIWATDLVERRSRQGGKGRPATTSYSYSASFAVALSSRPIKAVRRIWADGNLLRGVAGDWKQETGFRLHLGTEDQQADPFIASAEGVGSAPAYRSLAYAVFENMALEPYGNRIPSLTFEVEADAGPVRVGALLEELSGAEIAGSGSGEVIGYAASGDSLTGLIDQLAQSFPLTTRDTGDVLAATDTVGAVLQIPEQDVRDAGRRSRGAAAPGTVSISHYDPQRDFQIGVQDSAQAHGMGTERIELPVALNAGDARSLAEAILRRRQRQRVRRSVKCGWKQLAISPGDFVSVGNEMAIWQVERCAAERDGVTIDLISDRPSNLAAVPADPGRNQPAPDLVHGPTVLRLLDIPALDDLLPTGPRLLIAAAGQQPGWRRANLLVSLDQGATWQAIGRTALPAIIGNAETVLPPASPRLFDAASSLVVSLAHDSMQLEDADDTRLLAGANLVGVGSELLQFGAAAPLGDNRWRLSRLLRGRRGTEWAMGQHAVGDGFVLIEPEALQPYALPSGAAGAQVKVLASGVGDAVPVEAVAQTAEEALRPPAPVHLTARVLSDGSYAVAWIRRSRLGWAWGETEAPLAEAVERYRVTVRRADGQERSAETAQPAFLYESAAVLSDQSVGDHVTILVEQIGTRAISRPAELTISF